MTVIALDVGTSSVRASVCDDAGQVQGGRFHREPLRPTVTPDGGVEHDPARLLETVATCLDAVLVGRMPTSAVRIATFWHGLLGFDATGQALTPIFMGRHPQRRRRPAAARGARRPQSPRTDGVPRPRLVLAGQAPLVVSRAGRRDDTRRAVGLVRRVPRAEPVRRDRHERVDGLGHRALRSGRAALGRRAGRRGAGAVTAVPAVRSPRRSSGAAPAWSRRWPALRSAVWLAVGDGAASNVGSGCVDPSRMALNVGTSAALRVSTTASTPAPRGAGRYRLDRRLTPVGGALSEGGNVYEWCRGLASAG